MLIKPVSDTHTEQTITQVDMFAKRFCEPSPLDKETILVLAGDIGTLRFKAHLTQFLQQVCHQYSAVVYVPGNHEFYGTTFEEGCAILDEIDSRFQNLFILKAGMPGVVIGGFVFFGDVMWTKVGEQHHFNARFINDYSMIKVSKKNPRRITPGLTSFLHMRQRMKIEQSVKLLNGRAKNMKKVLVSHHGPSPVADHPDFKNSYVKAYFHNLELTPAQVNFYKQFDLIIHGHTHRCHDTIDPRTGVRTVSNCVGYQNEATGFNDSLLLSL